MRRTAAWGVIAAAVLGAICGAFYIEGASQAIILSTAHGASPMDKARWGECAARLAAVLGVVELAGVASLLWLTWRKWLRATGVFLVFYVTQFVVAGSAFLISQDGYARVVQGAGRLIRGCVCW